ncbi:helix-turn-helix domain-containing protein (plasmid) [Microtetraspora malaysiensis]|uniref:helix-turn-helix domain-containing protein n=1 Tax=Microtetraspora malaysiensis TaxID=161358 RepID=UPI003D8DAB4A
MRERISPPLRRRQLGRLLRGLRVQQGLTLDQVAQRVGWSRSRVGKLETGETRIGLGDLSRLLDVYEADKETRLGFGRLAKQAYATPWWQPYKYGLDGLGEFVSLETEARRIRYWQPQLVPGQLQTMEYAQAVLRSHYPWEDDLLITMRARARIARQWVTDCEDPVIVEAVIGEAALRHLVGGPQVMAGQLDALADAVSRPNIQIRVLPQSASAHAGLSTGFLLLNVASMPEILFLESGVGGIIDQGPQVEEFTARFAHIADSALSSGESVELIAAIRRDIEC